MTPRDLLAGLRAPSPRPELRDQVLAAARRAGLERRVGWIDRVWESPRVRAAWLFATCVLLVLHLAVPASQRPHARTRLAAAAMLQTDVDSPALARELARLGRRQQSRPDTFLSLRARRAIALPADTAR